MHGAVDRNIGGKKWLRSRLSRTRRKHPLFPIALSFIIHCSGETFGKSWKPRIVCFIEKRLRSIPMRIYARTSGPEKRCERLCSSVLFPNRVLRTRASLKDLYTREIRRGREVEKAKRVLDVTHRASNPRISHGTELRCYNVRNLASHIRARSHSSDLSRLLDNRSSRILYLDFPLRISLDYLVIVRAESSFSIFLFGSLAVPRYSVIDLAESSISIFLFSRLLFLFCCWSGMASLVRAVRLAEINLGGYWR